MLHELRETSVSSVLPETSKAKYHREDGGVTEGTGKIKIASQARKGLLLPLKRDRNDR
jgi:hypothetical protein